MELVVHGPGNVSLYRGWSSETPARVQDAIRRFYATRDRDVTDDAVEQFANAALQIAEIYGTSPEDEAIKLATCCEAFR